MLRNSLVAQLPSNPVRIPSEKETREFFLRLNFFLDPVDHSRGHEAVRARVDAPDSQACWCAPSLTKAWEMLARAALRHRRQAEQVDAVVRYWETADSRGRRAVRAWLTAPEGADDAAGPWARTFASLSRSLPSFHLSADRLPRGWRAQMIRDTQACFREPVAVLTVKERVRHRLEGALAILQLGRVG